MTAAVWFWLIFVLSLIFGIGWNWRLGKAGDWAGLAGLVPYILIGLLGWSVFGGPIK